MITFEITNGCTCTEYDEETETETESTYCYGCFEDEREQFGEVILKPWLDLHNLTEENVIGVCGVENWNKVYNEYFPRANAVAVIKSLTINTHFILRFTLDGDKLTCVRSSHDEHGSGFDFQVLGPGVHDEVEMRGWIIEE